MEGFDRGRVPLVRPNRLLKQMCIEWHLKPELRLNDRRFLCSDIDKVVNNMRLIG